MKAITGHSRTLNYIKHMLRAGIACTFIGHGMNAIAVKQGWISLLTVYGFSVEQAKLIMPYIGVSDLVVALCILVYPHRTIIWWAIFWTFATAATRVIAGEPVWEFIERAANWSAPIALLTLSNIKIYEVKNPSIQISKRVT